MTIDKSKCPVCKTHDTVIDDSKEMRKIECPLCGHYRISREQMFCDFSVSKHLLSGVIRNTWETTGKEFEVYCYKVDSMESLQKVSPVQIPNGSDVPAKANLILRHLQRKSTYPGKIITLASDQNYSVGFCDNKYEFVFCRSYLLDLKVIENVPKPLVGQISNDYRITPSGWAYLSGIGADAAEQGFIAMSFKPELKPVSDSGIYPGIKKAGYKPLRIDRKDHNNRIDDEIVAEIRKSRFIVADLTGNNQGAYYEAGFAQGLGKPVIWTCEKNQLEAKDLHFDVRQYSIVTWEIGHENLKDFAKHITQRIEATIGHGRYAIEE
ncbi:MAG: hypothetical protein WC340_17025 [Kiritimatiellia bacterium]